MPVLYYIRHGETDWNAEGRLQGGHDIPLNATGRAQARRSGDILRDLLACDSRTADALDFVSSPLGRARETMEIVRTTLGLQPQSYRIDPRLTEISFGIWEGFTLTELRVQDASIVAARENDKWNYVLPGGESYAAMSLRMRRWYDSLAGDAVVAAHGGTLRGLIVQLGIALPQDAPFHEVAQGVVYRVASGIMNRYA